MRREGLNRALPCSVEFRPFGKRVEVPAGTQLWDAAEQGGIALSSDCGGEGHCGRCRVIIRSTKVPSVTTEDRRTLDEAALTAGFRLACRAVIEDDLVVEVPPASMLSATQVKMDGMSSQIDMDPVVQVYELELAPPSPNDSRPDMSRVVDCFENKYQITGLRADVPVLSQFSQLVRELDWKLTAFVREREIIGFGQTGSRPLGVAIDLGTSKLVAYLVDLRTGGDLGVATCLNPQIALGEDVVTRLHRAARDQDAKYDLANLIRESIRNLIRELLTGIAGSPTHIAEVCVVANTAMVHLLLALPTENLARSPFVSVVGSSLDVRARDLDLELAPGAYVHVLPSIGGFVGADHVAMIMSCGIDRMDACTVGLDIGTNTEIVLSVPDGTSCRLLAGSCASGPAFEGAHISDGMRSSAGAIERVRITENGTEVRTIGNVPAVGICGSGIVDAVAELLRRGVIGSTGSFSVGHPRVRERHGILEYLLVPSDRSGSGRDIVLTRKDIDTLQLAKAAIRGRIQTLLKVAGITEKEVRRLVVDGGFGFYLDLESAVGIGLLPDLPEAEYVKVGNAAGVGARMTLLSRRERVRAEGIARQVQYVELATQPGFAAEFSHALRFPDHK